MTQPQPFTVYPAIDVRGGRVVRLRQGDYAKETRYSADPLAVARDYADQGATWLHLVDLDAARTDEGYSLLSLLSAVVEQTGLRVQTGGGVRSADEVARLLDAGAERVIVGSLAVRDPERVALWLKRFGPERLAVALDTRPTDDGNWVLPVAGWTSVEPSDLPTTLHAYDEAGLRHLLCTDISRDGTFAGPNLNLYTMLVHSVPGLLVQASGGARDKNDIRNVRKAGCAGMVLGKALLEGRLSLEHALAEETG